MWTAARICQVRPGLSFEVGGGGGGGWGGGSDMDTPLTILYFENSGIPRHKNSYNNIFISYIKYNKISHHLQIAKLIKAGGMDVIWMNVHKGTCGTCHFPAINIVSAYKNKYVTRQHEKEKFSMKLYFSC